MDVYNLEAIALNNKGILYIAYNENEKVFPCYIIDRESFSDKTKEADFVDEIKIKIGELEMLALRMHLLRYPYLLLPLKCYNDTFNIDNLLWMNEWLAKN